MDETNRWAAAALKWWLVRLLKQIAAEHERAAKELRDEAAK